MRSSTTASGRTAAFLVTQRNSIAITTSPNASTTKAVTAIQVLLFETSLRAVLSASPGAESGEGAVRAAIGTGALTTGPARPKAAPPTNALRVPNK